MDATNDTNWITRLSIEVASNSNKVFGNGRHQLKVYVTVVPKAGIDITEEQLDSIRLVTIDDDGNYQELSDELVASTERDTRFEYYADTGFAPRVKRDASLRRRKFYVSSSRSGGTLDVIYAAISKDEDTHYVSHTSKFNSSVTVETLTPLRLNTADFELTFDDNHDEEKDRTRWDYDVYQLQIKSHSLKIIESTPEDGESGAPYFQYIEDHGWEFQGLSWINNFTSYTHYAYGISQGAQVELPGVTLSVDRHPNSMVFVRVATWGIENLSGVQNQSSRWKLLDQYGNEHGIEMTQPEKGNRLGFIMTE